MTINQQIQQLAAESAAGWEKTESNLGNVSNALVNRERSKINFAKNKIETINAITDELGDIHAENVREVRDEILKNFKSVVVKERKMGKVGLGKTIDLEKVSQFDSDIRRLSRLAENSKVVDKMFKAANDSIDQDDLITPSMKETVKDNALRILADRDILENLSMEDLSMQLSEAKKQAADPVRLIQSQLADQIGEESQSTKIGDQSFSYTIPNILKVDQDNLSIDYSPAGKEMVGEVVDRLRGLGYNMPENILETYKKTLSSKAETDKGDQLERMLKQQRLRNLKKEDSPDNDGINDMVRLLQNFNIMDEGGYGETSERAMSYFKNMLKARDVEGISHQEMLSNIEQKKNKGFTDDNLIMPSKKGEKDMYLKVDYGDRVEYINVNDPESSTELRSKIMSVANNKSIEDAMNADWKGINQLDELIYRSGGKRTKKKESPNPLQQYSPENQNKSIENQNESKEQEDDPISFFLD